MPREGHQRPRGDVPHDTDPEVPSPWEAGHLENPGAALPSPMVPIHTVHLVWAPKCPHPHLLTLPQTAQGLAFSWPASDPASAAPLSTWPLMNACLPNRW